MTLPLSIPWPWTSPHSKPALRRAPKPEAESVDGDGGELDATVDVLRLVGRSHRARSGDGQFAKKPCELSDVIAGALDVALGREVKARQNFETLFKQQRSPSLLGAGRDAVAEALPVMTEMTS